MYVYMYVHSTWYVRSTYVTPPEPLGGRPPKRKSRAKESKMSSTDTTKKPTNQKTIYTKTKYTQTPDPPPYSGRLRLVLII